ncbi:hypothetical protein N0V90_000060 [Kalmusia sp. IMI 367209]|nr:hypothetical protein N0V90_000060 [Kalmusia sp. IMI 367209]
MHLHITRIIIMAPPAPTIMTSFLSVKPFEPVLVFPSAEAAEYFQSKARQGRILPNHSSKWVFLPLPAGLLRVRTANNGDVAYDFESRGEAKAFNDSIKGLGSIFSSTADKPTWDRTVYVGKQLK